MISLRIVTWTELPRTRTFRITFGLAINQSFKNGERNALWSWEWFGGQDALGFGKGHDLLGTPLTASTEDWEITCTSFSEEEAIWRIVPFSNAEEFAIISTKQIESTHFEEQPTTVSYFPFLLIRSSSFVLLLTLFLLPTTPSHLHQLLSEMCTGDKSIFVNFDVSQNWQMNSTVSCSYCSSSPPATLRTKREPSRPKISHTPSYRTFVFSEHKIQLSEREPPFQRIIFPAWTESWFVSVPVKSYSTYCITLIQAFNTRSFPFTSIISC